MTLGELIGWLETKDPSAVVKDGFSTPHSYRGYYERLAFTPERETTFGEMLEHSKSALGKVFQGYPGGDFLMDEDTECYLAEYGFMGEPVTPTHLKYWDLQASLSR